MSLYAEAVAAERAAKIERDMKDHEAGIEAMRQKLAACEAENLRLRSLLYRYRSETPPGHQPHMIAHIVDETLATPTGDQAALREWGARLLDEYGLPVMAGLVRNRLETPECLK